VFVCVCVCVSGNLYFASISIKESHLKHSSSFFHMVMKEDQKNLYAANGLGMLSAATMQYDAAREIFSRVSLR
jgi:hypothetical protein